MEAMPITRAARPIRFAARRAAASDDALLPALPSVKRRRASLSSSSASDGESEARPAAQRPRRDSNSSVSSGSETAQSDEGSDTAATPDGVLRERDDGCTTSGASASSSEEEYEEDNAFDPYLFIKNLQSTPYGDITGGVDARICLPRKTRSSPPISLVLDLDETLVHCSVHPIEKADLTFSVPCVESQVLTVQVCERPHLMEFLEQVSQWFEIIVFTASQRVYAETLLNMLDPERRLIRCVLPVHLSLPALFYFTPRDAAARHAHISPPLSPFAASLRRMHTGTACTATRASSCGATKGMETT